VSAVEPVDLGQLLWDSVPGRGRWDALREEVRRDWQRSAQALAAHLRERGLAATLPLLGADREAFTLAKKAADALAAELEAERIRHAATVRELAAERHHVKLLREVAERLERERNLASGTVREVLDLLTAAIEGREPVS